MIAMHGEQPIQSKTSYATRHGGSPKVIGPPPLLEDVKESAVMFHRHLAEVTSRRKRGRLILAHHPVALGHSRSALDVKNPAAGTRRSEDATGSERPRSEVTFGMSVRLCRRANAKLKKKLNNRG